MKPRENLNLRFTKDVRTLETCRLDLESGVTAEVFGDPENGSYELRCDAERYRVLREHWVRIESGTTVHRARGLDLWCDERRSASNDAVDS
ncbi:TPA: hypothetical protein NID13_000194 [Pseudomonas aeruginosa]|nr:hypothetical protein [Pseudomonas aeruginosa]